MNNMLDKIIAMSWQAMDIIKNFYDKDVGVTKKKDGTPVTQADIAANEIICTELQKIWPDTTIISEEKHGGLQGPFPAEFFLVDPLDGTKEFINKRDEFTTNIALVKNGVPILGVVGCPAFNTIYFGGASGAFKQHKGHLAQQIKVSPPSSNSLIVTGSRSHGNTQAFQEYLGTPKIEKFIPAGSSLKFCKIAEGIAHLYPRLGRTMEWDTAAGHAVLNAAGGSVTLLNGTPLKYGKSGLDNPHFVASFKGTK